MLFSSFFPRFFVIFFGFALLVAACKPAPESQQNQAGSASAGPPVTITRPISKKVVDWNEYTGRFAAIQHVEVRSRVSGYINSTHFKDGQIVNEGDLLFVIDPRPYQAVLDAAKADLSSAQAQAELAQRELNRANELVKKKIVAQSNVDERQQQLASAQARVQAAEAAIREAELNVEFTQIKAPIRGKIGRELSSQGNLINGGSSGATLLTTIVSLDPIYFYFDADQNTYLQYLRQSEGKTPVIEEEARTPVQLALADETDFNHVGVVDFWDNQVDNSTGTIRVRAVFDNPRGLFTPGMFGRLRLQGPKEYDALLIPDEAIGTDQSRRFVYIVDDKNAVTYRPVTLGQREDNLRVIREGLTPIDRVIIAGTQHVRPGMTVTPQERVLDQQPPESAGHPAQ